MSGDQIEILLVEDDSDDLELTMHSLSEERAGNRIFVARDGEEALDFLFCRGAHGGRDPDCRPKLILLDLKLPKVDGLEVLKQLKSDSRTSAVPVVVLTSSKQERDLVRSYQSGVNSYIQKPVDFDRFRAVVKQLGVYWLRVNEPPPQMAFHGGTEDAIRSCG
ncbi:MAG: response regulator [Bryobacteraceae bacterium]|jgi:CheY-like chemotaxis protein